MGPHCAALFGSVQVLSMGFFLYMDGVRIEELERPT